MFKRHVVVFLIVLAAATCAHANLIVNGSVYNRDLNGNTCSSSNSSATALALSCGSTTDFTIGLASLTANIGATSGSAHAIVNSFEFPPLSGFSTLGSTNFSLLVNGTYLLTGGTGFGTAKLTVDEQRHGAGGGGTFMCSLGLGLQVQDCSATGGAFTYSFLVPYNSPLALNFNLNFTGSGIDSDAVDSSVTYNFTSITPTPEPISLLLFGTGLIPLAAWRRRVSPASSLRD